MKFAIVGGGLTGLTAAYDLVRQGYQVTLYESATVLGGLAGGFKDPSWSWTLEKYYHHWFASDQALLTLLKDLSLSSKLIFKKPSTVVAYNHRYYPLDTPQAILRFPGFSFQEKIRFGLATAYLKYLAPWQPLEKYTAKDYAQKLYGKSLYQFMWQPLLQGKFGPYAQKVNMAWLWARLKARTPSLGTYQGGFQTFVDDFVKKLKHLGVTLHTATEVNQITPSSQSFKVTINHHTVVYDRVLVTTAPHLLTKLVPSLPKTYAQPLLNLKYLGALVVVLALKQPLSPQKYYWYNLKKTSTQPFLALVEHTNFMASSHYGGDTLVYCGDYAPPEDRRFSQTKASLVKSTHSLLKSINPKFTPEWIRKAWVYRTPYAQPVPLPNHSRRLPSLKTPFKGLYFASMSHIYPWDRGTNYAVGLGHKVALLMLKESQI